MAPRNMLIGPRIITLNEYRHISETQSNGMAESFVKTIKRDYVDFMPKPDAPTAIGNLAIAFEHYNEYHPHSALRYHSPREFRRKAMATR